MTKRILFALTLLLALLSVNTYKYLQEEKNTQLNLSISQEKNDILCIELYINNNYNKPILNCNGINGDYTFKNLPKLIKNLRIDFGDKPNATFVVKNLTIGTKEKAREITNLKDWGSDQITMTNGKYITTGNDSKIFGAINYGAESTIWNEEYILYIPISLIIIVCLYIIYKSEKKYEISLEFIVITGYILGLVSAFPGHTNFDELYTLGEYYRGEVSDMHPPMQMLMSAKIIEFGKLLGFTPLYSISIILIIQLGIYWWSLKEIAIFIKNKYLRFIFLSILCISPISIVYASHIGKDSQMAIALLFSIVLIIKSSSENRFLYLILAIFPIFYAYTIRANAPAAVIPVIVYWSAVLIKSKLNFKKYIPNAAIPTIIFLLLINIFGYLINREVIKIKCCSGIQLIMTPVYDLMGVSKAVKINLVPSFLYISNYDLADINANFDSTYINWNGLKQANYDQIIPVLEQWYEMVKKYPNEFVDHRINTLKYFFGLQGGRPAFPYMSGFYDNIEKTGKSNITFELVNGYENIKSYLYLKEVFSDYFASSADSIFYRYWIYILLNIIIYILMISKGIRLSILAKILAFSSILYVLPYFFLANSAQFRYVYWPALACYILIFINLDKLIIKKLHIWRIQGRSVTLNN